MLTAVLAFLRSPVGRSVLLGVAVFFGALWIRAHWIGQGVRQERAAEAVRASVAAKSTVKHEAAAAVISTDAGRALATSQAGNRARTITLTREVPIYVTPKADASCTVPVGFVRLHDTAAAGPAGVPSASGGPLDANSGVPLSAVANTVVANYGAAYDWRSEVLIWRDWYARQKAAWDKP